MTIKQQGGIFGRNPSFNDVDVENVDVENIDISVGTVTGNLTLNGSGSGNGLIKNSGTGFGVGTDRWIGADGSDDAWFFNVPTGGQHYFAINNSNKLSISGNDVNVLLGNLVIGTSGKGIDFSATSDASGSTSELFDDYEEGTWTGKIADAASSGNESSSTVYGNYVKIGNMVYVDFNVSNIDTTGLTSGNDVYITGLPFTSASVSGSAYYSGTVVTSVVTFSNEPILFMFENATSLLLNENRSASGSDFIVVSELSSGVSDIHGNLCYRAA